MNRVEFIGQTHQGTLVSINDIIRYFDNTMAAYDVIGGIDGISVRNITDSCHSSLKLKIESSNLAKLRDIVDYINDTLHNQQTTYGKSFRIDCTVDGDSVDMFVREEY